jgi:hypothetical protein
MKLLGSAPRTNPASFYRNSDLAFWGRLAFAGDYEGFRVIDVADPRRRWCWPTGPPGPEAAHRCAWSVARGEEAPLTSQRASSPR